VAQQVVGKALRDTLFLAAFGVRWLPYAMIASAAVSGVVVLAVSRAALARSPRRVAVTTLLLSALLFLAAWGVQGVSARGAAAITWLHAGALSAAAVSVFWALVSESFDPYAARASVPRILAGATLGGAVGGLATWRAAGVLPPSDLLPAAAALGLVALAAVARLGRAAPQRAAEPSGDRWRALLAELPQLRLLGLLVLAGAASQAILDYLLSSAAVGALGSGPRLLSFFALFQTAVGILSFLLQVAVSRSALERYGVGPVLAASPLLVLAGAFAAPVLPPLAAAVLLRGTDGVLGASLHRSAYEVLFAPVELERKRASKPLLDVGFDRAGMLLGGALVAVVSAVAASGARAVLLAAVAGLAAVRLLVAPRLHAGYRGTLADNLRLAALGRTGALDRSVLGAASLAGFDLPGAPELPPLPADGDGAAVDEDVALLAALRSGEVRRTKRVLRERHTRPLLAPQVVQLLGDDRVARDAADWLTAQDPPPAGLLGDALLDDRLSDATRRRVARLLGKLEDPRAGFILLAAVQAVPTGVRHALATALCRASERTPLPAEPLLAAARRAALEPSRGEPRAELEEIFSLLGAAWPGEPLLRSLRALERGGEARGTALEWLDVLLPHDVKAALWPRIVRRGERIAGTPRDRAELRERLRGEELHPEREGSPEGPEDA
jgi:hypothetical protein